MLFIFENRMQLLRDEYRMFVFEKQLTVGLEYSKKHRLANDLYYDRGIISCRIIFNFGELEVCDHI